MRLTVLGSGTAIPHAQRGAPGHLVQLDKSTLLFDAGPGTLHRLLMAGVSYLDIDVVFISHLHSDHVLDLVTLMQDCLYAPHVSRTRPLHFVGCRGLRATVNRLFDEFGLQTGSTPFVFDITELGEERLAYACGDWSLETACTGHTDTSLAFRIEAEGRVIVYTGDATELPGLTRLAHDADVLLCECSFPCGWPPTNHLNADAVGRIAHAAGVKRLVLTHLYPPALDADIVAQIGHSYMGPVIVATDLTRMDLDVPPSS